MRNGGRVVIVETKAACMVKTTLQYAKKYTEFSVHRCVYSDRYCFKKTPKHSKQTRSDRREQGQKKIFRRTPPERMRLKTTNLLYAYPLDRNSHASTKNSPKDLSFQRSRLRIVEFFQNIPRTSLSDLIRSTDIFADKTNADDGDADHEK